MYNKRKICVVTGYRSDYTKLKCVLDEIKESNRLILDIVTLGAHNLSSYNNTSDIIQTDGFEIKEHLNTNVEGDSGESMVMSMGLVMLQIGRIFKKLCPDIVMIVGDRYEIVPVALSATSMNIPVCHIQGGEVSGTIDEIYRHTVTKLSHIHFPSTSKSRERILRLGEDSSYVYDVGCPAIDYIHSVEIVDKEKLSSLPGLSSMKQSDYVLLMQHPVTTENNSYEQMIETLEALQAFGKDVILIYPNPDPGAKKMLKAIREFERKYNKKCVIKNKFKNLNFEVFINLLKHSFCLVGNSSCGIREAYALKKYVIDVGTRQKNRERSENVYNVDYDRREVTDTLNEIQKIFTDYPSITNVYGDGNAAKKIVKIIEKISIKKIINKRLTYDV